MLFNLHSIINNGLILGGQNSSKRQTVFFLPVDPRDKEHKDPEQIDLNVPRRAQYMHNAWKRHQDAVCWVDIDLAIRKGLKFYQTRSNAIILQGTLPAYCIPKVVRLKTGEVLYEKVFMSPPPPPKISLKHEWTRELGSKVDRQPEGEVARQPEGEAARQQEGEIVRQTKFFQSTQPTPNPIRDISGRPDNMKDGRNTSRSQEIHVNSVNEELSSSGRTGRLVETEVNQTRSSEDSMIEQGDLLLIQLQYKTTFKYVMKLTRSTLMKKYFVKEWRNPFVVHDENHEPMMVNEADMDFRIPGLPHSVVKHAQSTSVRQLIQKIENHPNRHALQRDQQQNQSFNPFSPE